MVRLYESNEGNKFTGRVKVVPIWSALCDECEVPFLLEKQPKKGDEVFCPECGSGALVWWIKTSPTVVRKTTASSTREIIEAVW